MEHKTCRLCLEGHERDDIFCATCRRFADWWTSLRPDECRRYEQAIVDGLSGLERGGSPETVAVTNDGQRRLARTS
jgi:hypothetical protein